MNVQLAAVPYVGATDPNPNVIVFSNGKTVEIKVSKKKQRYGRQPGNGAVIGNIGWYYSMDPECFIGIWQNSADLDEAYRAVKHVEEYITDRKESTDRLDVSGFRDGRRSLKNRATRLKNKGVNLKRLEDPAVAAIESKKRERKEKYFDDLKELAASLA
jgi:nucleoid DNA-binding protein